MNHQDHVHLLRRGIANIGGQWADLGSGDGAFTLALRDLIGGEAEIFSVEKDSSRLEQQKINFHQNFSDSKIHFINADFTYPLELPLLDGIVMANALHFICHKETLLDQLRGYLKPNGRFLLVEYNVDSGNQWVPHPLSYESFRQLAPKAGLTEPTRLARLPSRFLREIYSALCFNTDAPPPRGK